MTAEALYTITTLVHTSSSVAVKSSLSDLSFRAILRVLAASIAAENMWRQPGERFPHPAKAAGLTGRHSRLNRARRSRRSVERRVTRFEPRPAPEHRARSCTPARARSCVSLRARLSSQQSSAGGGEDTALADRGSLRSQRTVPYRTSRTDDCSLLTRAVPCLLQPTHFLFEHATAFGVVAKHVEARTRRREQHRVSRRG
jgi:hypothetical protein